MNSRTIFIYHLWTRVLNLILFSFKLEIIPSETQYNHTYSLMDPKLVVKSKKSFPCHTTGKQVEGFSFDLSDAKYPGGVWPISLPEDEDVYLLSCLHSTVRLTLNQVNISPLGPSPHLNNISRGKCPGKKPFIIISAYFG